MTPNPKSPLVEHIREASALSRTLFRSCSMSNELFKPITSEIASFRVGLEMIEDDVMDASLYEEHHTKLQSLVSESYEVLLALQALLNYYDTLPTASQLSWERLDASAAQVNGIKEQLRANVQLLTSFTSSLSRYVMDLIIHTHKF